MIKRIVPIVIVFILVGVMVVQAVEKDRKENKNLIMTKGPSNEELNQLYNNIMSSQIEEEPEEEATPEGLNVGLKAPDFQLETIQGISIRLSDLKGKKTFINFFATWCTPCKTEMPILEEFSKEHSKDMNVIAINIDTKANVKHYISDLGLTFPVLLDKNGLVNEKYQIVAIPTSYLLDENGVIINKHIGALNKEQLNEMVK
ncbi:TlpA family protein disulfide reductase [Heyndrickxia sporothermodurans]